MKYRKHLQRRTILSPVIISGLLLVAATASAAVDSSFNCILGGESGEVFAMVKQPDGKYVIGGSISSVKGVPRYGIARLLPSGTVDSSFDAGLILGGSVYAIASLQDGHAIIAGSFTNINGTPRFGLACLKSDGSIENAFNPNAGAKRAGKPATITALAVQADGSILIGGYFDTANGVAKQMIARMNSAGVLDTNFSGAITSGMAINAIALQNDGRILVGGGFSQVSNTNRQNLARLLPDGSLDLGFDPSNQVYTGCYSILPLTDGRVIVAGNNYCRRLSSDGRTVDPTFVEPEMGLNSSAYTVSATPGGGYAVGGEFYRIGNRFNLAGVAFGTNMYVAVGDSILNYLDYNPSRADLVNFKSQGSLRSPSLTGIAFGTAHFATCSRSSTILISVDGTNWTSRTTDAALGFNNMAYANGKFVAVGPNGMIRTSADDGVTWNSPVNSPTVSELNAAVSSSNQWIAVGGAPGTGVVVRSPDGSSWSSASPTTNVLYGVAYGNNQFIAVGERGCILRSTDGQAWDWVTNRYSETLFSVAFGNNIFIAVGANGRILYSPNGYGWTNVYNYSSQLPQQTLKGITFANTKFIAVGGNGTLLASDPGYAAPNLYLVPRMLTDRDSVSVLMMEENGLLRTNFTSGINDLLSNYKETVRAIAPETNGLVVAGNFVKVNYTNSGDVARLKPDGTLDLTMRMDMGAASEGTPSVILPLNDGKILIGGDFTSVNGVERPRLVRINSNGSVDTAFDAGVNVDRPITSIALCPNGQIAVGGNGNVYGRRPVARLNNDGSLDSSFVTTLGGSTYNDTIFAMVVQNDGRIIVNGSTKRVARLNTNGTDDVSFNIGTGATGGSVSGIGLQPDGKIVLGGTFTNFNGRSANGVMRLWPTGTNDESFIAKYGTGTTQGVSSVLVRTSSVNGAVSIYLGGAFTNMSGLPCGHVARLNEDGTPDAVFAANTTSLPPFKFDALAATATGDSDTIDIAGARTNASGTAVEYFAFLNSNGSIRSSVTSSFGPDGRIYALGPVSTSKVLVGGLFRSMDGNRWLDIALLQEDVGGLTDWKATVFTAAELADLSISGDNADPDHDGIANFVEYAINSSPKDPQRSALPCCAVQINSADGKPYLLYSYHRRVGTAGVQYTMEASSDLVQWDAASSRFEEMGVLGDANGVTESVTVRIKPSITESSRTFVRLTIRPQ